ncbi:MAG: thioredoxin domain-containing protein [Balneolaceae bacterium]|nr:thioredoxin domain-containing protein [Balneolaceae bacterium]
MNKRILLWSTLIGVMLLIVYIMISLADNEPVSSVNNDAPNTISSDDIPGILQVRGRDWTKGNPQAEVVIIKYSDFQCPACRYYAAFDDQLSKEAGEEILFVYRHFPLQSFQYSRMAAIYAEAAGRQGEFWSMHNLIYINQHQWSGGNAESLFRQYAETLHLDMDQLDKDLQDPSIAERIQSDYESGRELGVNSVPALFINGDRIQNPNSQDAYRELIESYINE